MSDLLMLRMDIAGSENLPELRTSIDKHGVLQPIIVRPVSGKEGSSSLELESANQDLGEGAYFEIICGHRRFFACQALGLETIPAIVREMDDRVALELALVENLQRESLSPIEEAEAFKKYVVNFGRGSMTSLAGRIGKSEVYVSHRLLLLGLPKSIIEKISRRLLKPGQACELVWLKDERKQLQLADEIVSKNLSVKETRNLVKTIRDQKLSVSSAVQQRVKDLLDKKSVENISSLETGPWQGYQSDNIIGTDYMRSLKHAELILRTCLSGLDGLIENSDRDQLRNLILNERQSVHRSLDNIIQAQVAHRKSSRR
jgi:ParB/RepB/Spo0J family partition protein